MKRKSIFSSAVCIMILLIITTGGCSGGGNSSGLDGNTDLESVLDALGISRKVDDRTDPNGKALRADYNPLGKKVNRINKLSEIYLAGSCLSGNSYSDTLFDPANNSTITYDSDGGWAKSNYFKTVGADTDGDGHDEIITAVFNVTKSRFILKETKYNSSYTRKDVVAFDDSEIVQAKVGYRIDTVGDIAAGDIDGDGREEIAVVYGSTLLIIDDASAGYAILAKKKIASVASGYQLLRVRMGDFDQDGKDEIVLTNGIGIPDNSTTAQYTIYDDLASDPSMSNPLVSAQPITAYFTSGIVDQIVNPSLTGTKSIEAAGITVGDFNNDGLPDIAFAGNSSIDKGCYMFILQTSMNKDSKPQFKFLPVAAYDASYEYAAPPIESGDLNGDGKDEIVMWKGVYYINNTDTLSLMGVTITATGKPIYDFKVGDIDGDYKDEIVILYNLDCVCVYEYDASSNSGNGDIKAKGQPISITSANALPWGTLALPSTKKACEVVEFIGHEVKFSDPRIVAVLAAPPYYSSLDGADKNEVQPFLGNIGTSFGKSNTSSYEQSNSFGFNVSFSWGASVSCPLWNSVASSTMKTTLSNDFNWTASETTDVTCSCSYTNGTDDDMVVFAVIPFDVYSYKVLNSADPNVVGQTVTINLPKKPITTSQSVTFYNKNNGGYFDVGKDVLVHTVGEPFTYMTSAGMAKLQVDKPKGLYIPTTYAQTVGEGTSGTTLSMQSSVTKSKNFSYDLSLTNEVEMVAVGILVGRGIGFNYGYSYSTSVTDSTEIEGQVANIASAHYNKNRLFTWGLMAYPYTDKASSQSFNVVTYWVNKI